MHTGQMRPAPNRVSCQGFSTGQRQLFRNRDSAALNKLQPESDLSSGERKWDGDAAAAGLVTRQSHFPSSLPVLGLELESSDSQVQLLTSYTTKSGRFAGTGEL